MANVSANLVGRPQTLLHQLFHKRLYHLKFDDFKFIIKFNIIFSFLNCELIFSLPVYNIVVVKSKHTVLISIYVLVLKHPSLSTGQRLMLIYPNHIIQNSKSLKRKELMVKCKITEQSATSCDEKLPLFFFHIKDYFAIKVLKQQT